MTRVFRSPLLLSSLLPGLLVGQAGRRLDTTTFVVVGEGLAAGMADYGLSREVQEWSFPSQMARQFGTIFPQPLIQGPGLEGIFGLDLPVARIPTYPQTTVRVFPFNPSKKKGEVDGPSLFVFNLSMPNWRLADSLTKRPTRPLVQPHNPQQTSINLILGFPSLILENEVPLWTQFEYAKAMNPTLALVELGYFEGLEAAAAANPNLIPSAATFRSNYSTVVKGLRDLNAQVVVTTIPDPTAAAYFMAPALVARLLETEPAVLATKFGVRGDDLVTRPALYNMSNQLLSGTAIPLPPRSILPAAAAADIRARISALNTAISEISRENGALLYDMNRFFASLRESGISAAGRQLTAEYLGGFYSQDGVYPSITGHGLIANDMLRFLNSSFGQSYRLVDLPPLVARDPAVSMRGPQ